MKTNKTMAVVTNEMKASKIIANGKEIGSFSAPDGKRFVYALKGQYASCLKGGLRPVFEDKEELKAKNML